MKFTIKTPISKNYIKVMEGFDRKLFEFLKPIGAKMKIVEFSGSKTGDKVHIQFTSPIRTSWISKITDHGITEKEAFFIDEGTVLPWPIKKWRHGHIVKNIENNKSVIEDQIEFKTGNIIFDALILPIMYIAFYPRRSQYKKYFK